MRWATTLWRARKGKRGKASTCIHFRQKMTARCSRSHLPLWRAEGEAAETPRVYGRSPGPEGRPLGSPTAQQRLKGPAGKCFKELMQAPKEGLKSKGDKVNHLHLGRKAAVMLNPTPSLSSEKPDLIQLRTAKKQSRIKASSEWHLIC